MSWGPAWSFSHFPRRAQPSCPQPAASTPTRRRVDAVSLQNLRGTRQPERHIRMHVHRISFSSHTTGLSQEKKMLSHESRQPPRVSAGAEPSTDGRDVMVGTLVSSSRQLAASAPLTARNVQGRERRLRSFRLIAWPLRSRSRPQSPHPRSPLLRAPRPSPPARPQDASDGEVRSRLQDAD